MIAKIISREHRIKRQVPHSKGILWSSLDVPGPNIDGDLHRHSWLNASGVAYPITEMPWDATRKWNCRCGVRDLQDWEHGLMRTSSSCRQPNYAYLYPFQLAEWCDKRYRECKYGLSTCALVPSGLANNMKLVRREGLSSGACDSSFFCQHGRFLAVASSSTSSQPSPVASMSSKSRVLFDEGQDSGCPGGNGRTNGRFRRKTVEDFPSFWLPTQLAMVTD